MNEMEFEQAFNQVLADTDPVSLVEGLYVLGVLGIILLVGSIIWYFVSAIGYCKMFSKAGDRGWKAFIPFVRDYTRFKISWNPKLYWLYLAAVILAGVPGLFDGLVWTIIVYAASIALIVLHIVLCIKLAKSFGKGAGTGILLLFFTFIVSLVLGFGKSEYVGKGGAVAEKSEV